MGVLVKKSDIAAQWGAYQAAQASAQKATGVFERACNAGRPGAECQELWRQVGEAEAALEREWQAYKRIAPTKVRRAATI
jgi:hypothetical protein